MIARSESVSIEPVDSGNAQHGCTARRAVGRPRRLTLEAIVDAACEVGIERLEMSLVAERLNTGVATLYGYVRGRDHLLELVVEQMASRALGASCGGTWQDVLREHAGLCFAMFKSCPEMISKLVGGERTDKEVAYSTSLVAMLQARGLSAEQAAAVFVETNQAVIGAAVMLIRRNLLTCGSGAATVRPGSLPDVLGDYRPTLERIIRGSEERFALN